MKHLGDICKINGAEIPVVDVIIGGSPCQDLSVAKGKREGLEGSRSGLFMEMIRIIKEMRDNDRRNFGRSGVDVRPRYMVWENVPGAFSSNKGEDFRAVLEETARIADESVNIPRPDKWTKAGCIIGDDWSISWRVCNSQFWGVAQRRRRVSLIADFGGRSAPEISFVRKSVSGDNQQSEEKRKAVDEDAAAPAESVGKHNISFQERAGCAGGGKGILIQHDRVGTLTTLKGSLQSRAERTVRYRDKRGWNRIHGRCERSGCGRICVSPSGRGSRHNQYVVDTQPIAIENHPNDSRIKIAEDNVVQALSTRMGTGGNNTPLVAQVVALDGTLDAHYAQMPGCRGGIERTMVYTLNYIVRRLTPLECERLQGFPDNFTLIPDYIDSKGRKKSAVDSVRYKALGNSIALPQWKYILKKISSCYERDATMGSLFDGIGGFPYLWEQINGKGSCLWASEIEDFPIAVTKYHFSDDEVNTSGRENNIL